MEHSRGRQSRPHLLAGMFAAALAALFLFAGKLIALRLEDATISATAPEIFPLKNQGLAFQRAAARAANVLPIYGTSELLVPAAPERGNIFFRTAPTGFQLSPVGGGGMLPLIMVEKIGALGSDLRGKKVAISLSPNWFFATKPGWRRIPGIFSPMAANEMVFGSALDFKLKREIAARMLQCTSTLEGRPLLTFALERLARGRWFDRVIFWTVWPAGKMESLVLELEDHLAALHYIRSKATAVPRLHPQSIDWARLIARTSKASAGYPPKASDTPGIQRQIAAGSRDAPFRRGVETSPAWADLDLLLRTLASLHAQPLILSMPIPGNFYDDAGVSRAARQDFYNKLRALVQQYHFAVVEFEDHDEDPAFLLRHSSHLTARGWVYYDRALDNFFHGRAPQG